MQDECMLKVTEKITEKSSKLLDIRFKEQFFFLLIVTSLV